MQSDMPDVTFVKSIAITSPEAQAVTALYERMFPEGERVPTAELFSGGSGRNAGDGKNLLLGAKIDCALVGFINAEFIPDIRGAFVGYLAVHESYRSQRVGEGLVRQLIRAVNRLSEQETGALAEFLFTEIDVEVESHPNASKVRRFWARLGMMPIQGLRWEYPPLHEGERPHAMDLAVLPLGNQVLRTIDQIRSVVLAIYRDVYGVTLPDQRLARVLQSTTGWPIA